MLDNEAFRSFAGGATSNIKVKSQSIRLNRTLFKSADYQSF